MDVSENSGTPKSSILIGFSIINHPFWGIYPYFGKPQYIGVIVLFIASRGSSSRMTLHCFGEQGWRKQKTTHLLPVAQRLRIPNYLVKL